MIYMLFSAAVIKPFDWSIGYIRRVVLSACCLFTLLIGVCFSPLLLSQTNVTSQVDSAQASASIGTAAKNHAEKTSILALVSDRSASALVAGAHRYLNLQKKANASQSSHIQIRSITQINQLSDEQLQALLAAHSSLLFVGIFGESVERLLNLDYSPQQTRHIISSDRQLMVLHQDKLQGNFKQLNASQVKQLMQALDKSNYQAELSKQQQHWPQFSFWLQTLAYWQNRGADNISHLFSWVADMAEQPEIVSQPEQPLVNAPAIIPLQPVRFYWDDNLIDASVLQARLNVTSRAILFVLDHDTGDRDGEWQLHQKLCAEQAWQCISILAAWGQGSEDAVNTLSKLNIKQPFAVLSLQDFVIGGGEGRSQVLNYFKQMNVPILKGIRVTELSEPEYQISTEGLPSSSVHYRIAMPELQGVSQAQVLALAAPAQNDPITGSMLQKSQLIESAVVQMQQRITRWLALKTKPNHQKKVAIIFYNHPPGRHNIGADNLNVPESLWHILNTLKAQGYNVGDDKDFPQSSQALLDLLQQKAVNLPQDAGALAQMAPHINSLPAAQYQRYFNQLPNEVQAEMQAGPLGYLHAQINRYLFAQDKQKIAELPVAQRQMVLKQLLATVESSLHDLHHAIDGVRHKSRARALNLLEQLEQTYTDLIKQKMIVGTNSQDDINSSNTKWQAAESLKNALIDMQIEGVRGWGNIPGETMVWQNKLLIPSIQFGHVFIGPQPPRGWEIHEELLHANMTFPPPHQYLAFYYYIKEVFKSDAIIHLGRHSTYEFLPKRATGLSASDYPSLIIGDMPSIYPYIVDGVGEGIQAKRRGSAVMIDHLTPPLVATELYDGLLVLRQLIESAEAASDKETQQKAIQALRAKIDELNLRDELIASMDEELQVRGVGFSDVDDDFLLHEVGHYLTHLQEDFMPLGLHVFGQAWPAESVKTMLQSIINDKVNDKVNDKTNDKANQVNHSTANISDNRFNHQQIEANLIQSPQLEMQALLTALNGGFVAPGKGNDPIRTPEALPTGRNFFALDNSLIPSQLGFSIGQQLAKKARQDNPIIEADHKEAVILWASDAVRDEGAMIGFGLDMLGITPVWSKRGILKSLELLPLNETRTERRDLVFTTSGLFRDLYGEQLNWLDKAVLLAIGASKNTIIRDFPALTVMLNSLLKPVDALLEMQPLSIQHGLNEPLSQNYVAYNWVQQARALLLAQSQNAVALAQYSPEQLARQASLRIFGTAPGAYGAGINRLAERSGAWQDRKELGQTYIARMGHAYGVSDDYFKDGQSAQALFRQQLAKVNNTYLGRASNLYGLIDNNDAYDYLGGLNLAIETIKGEPPASFVISHANQHKLTIDTLQSALLTELRGRFLNPQWIKPLMKEGYAGARTMGSEFIENLWGWQTTSPEIIKDWVWQDVKAVYIDDSLQLGLSQFLQTEHNVHVQTNILAIMLVAIEKGFWQADSQTKAELAEQFANNIIEHGIPGSGHTHANHPIYPFVKQVIDKQKSKALDAVLAKARLAMQPVKTKPNYQHIQEINLDTKADNPLTKQANSQPVATQNVTTNLNAKQNYTDKQNNQQPTDDVIKDGGEALPALYYWLIGLAVLVLLAGFVRAKYLSH